MNLKDTMLRERNQGQKVTTGYFHLYETLKERDVIYIGRKQSHGCLLLGQIRGMRKLARKGEKTLGR